MIPRTHFHRITTWLQALLGKIRPFICLFCDFGLLARWRWQFLAGKRKYIFAQESFYLQDILGDINEQDTAFLDCKHNT